jgi:hypothetical protein
MRERAVATIAIWFSLALSIYLLLERLTYEEHQIIDGRAIPEVMVVQSPGLVQFGIFFLIFILITAAAGTTFMLWGRANQSGEMQQEAASAKLKREQKERVRRLLEQMDSDDLAALESRVSADGELMSIEELLEQGELQRRR